MALVNWAERLGPVAKIGIEGTGTDGAGLARFVRAYGLEVIEVDRPDRRCLGTSDPSDAHAAARATLAGVATTTPKTREDRSRCSGCAGWPAGAR